MIRPLNAKFTEQCCVDCRHAKKDVPHMHPSKVSCDKGYMLRDKLQKACRLFEAGEYKAEVKKGATV